MPALAKTSASETFWQHIPVALPWPAPRATSIDLCILACGPNETLYGVITSAIRFRLSSKLSISIINKGLYVAYAMPSAGASNPNSESA